MFHYSNYSIDLPFNFETNKMITVKIYDETIPRTE